MKRNCSCEKEKILQPLSISTELAFRQLSIACVASVSVAFFANPPPPPPPIFVVLDAREMGREQKREGEGRREGERKPSPPLPSPASFAFLLSSQFPRGQTAKNATETKRRLKDRFNEHRRLVDKTNTKSKPTTVSEHFLSQPNHCHTDMQLIPLELIHSSRDSIRKARESFLIDLAGTLEPHGLNRRDEL